MRQTLKIRWEQRMTNIHVNDASREVLHRRLDKYSKERVLMTVSQQWCEQQKVKGWEGRRKTTWRRSLKKERKRAGWKNWPTGRVDLRAWWIPLLEQVNMIMMMTNYIENTHKTYRSVKLAVKLTILIAILLHTSSTGVEAVDATG